MKIKELLLLFAAPAVLCSIVLSQYQMVRAHHLNPWERGGFAMFSTINKNSVRTLQIAVTLSDGAELLAPHPRSYRKQIRRLIQIPSKEEISLLAQSLADESWVAFTKRNVPDEKRTLHVMLYQDVNTAAPSAVSFKVKALELTVFEYQFEVATNQLKRHLIQSSELVEGR